MALTSTAEHAGRVRIPIAQAADEFLKCRRIAVTGVSRHEQGHGANVVFKRLQERGYDVFAVNPAAPTVDGSPAYPDLRSIPGGVEAVVIGTRPDRDEATILECADLGIKRVWMHRSIGGGSVSHDSAEHGRNLGMTVIEGGCPLMFEPVSDGAHKAMRFVLGLTGRVPRQV